MQRRCCAQLPLGLTSGLDNGTQALYAHTTLSLMLTFVETYSSLETFICQFHLWLAGDTKGLLVLLPWPRLRFLNMIFTTLIFLFVSNQIAVSTGQLTEWILGKQPKKAAATLPSASASGGQYVPLATMNGESTTVDGLPAEVKPVPSTFDKLLANLKFRCAMFMGLIWVINLLYPSYHPSEGHLLPTH